MAGDRPHLQLGAVMAALVTINDVQSMKPSHLLPLHVWVLTNAVCAVTNAVDAVLTNAVGVVQSGQVTCHIIQLRLHVRCEVIVHILRKVLLEEG